MTSAIRPSSTRLAVERPVSPAGPRRAGGAAGGVGERAMVIGVQGVTTNGAIGKHRMPSSALGQPGQGMQVCVAALARSIRPCPNPVRHRRLVRGATSGWCGHSHGHWPPRSSPRNAGHRDSRRCDCKNRRRQGLIFRVLCTIGRAQVGDLQRFRPASGKTWQAIKDLLLGLKKTVNSSRRAPNVGRFQAGFFKFPFI